ncbi:uncharacterized protein BDZ99DRAFT_519372 [Mytilinidion resinicola]|uniref:Uncharacterized protein n=1 Tax=Mytilinidion resinicola TaxID=574789 RepID=A0A6A6YRU6_9PEZI|nr:uncharacterized protein BDZ99DRAFT_519372 [Mytilinidion resinicola]KAF2810685.1 hypothetical protein BDZ99DRAFT_519372 [Mytilinidion resinicola]
MPIVKSQKPHIEAALPKQQVQTPAPPIPTQGAPTLSNARASRTRKLRSNTLQSHLAVPSRTSCRTLVCLRDAVRGFRRRGLIPPGRAELVAESAVEFCSRAGYYSAKGGSRGEGVRLTIVGEETRVGSTRVVVGVAVGDLEGDHCSDGGS